MLHARVVNFEIQDARHLLAKILLFTPVLLLVLAVNLSLDPEGLYSKKTHKYGMDEYHMAQALVAGKSVAIGRSIDDRLLQKYFIEDMTIAPDIVVLGSSPSAWLGDNIFSNKKVINNSVLFAELADYLGIFESYAKKSLYPHRVILLLSPQLIFPVIMYGNRISIKEDISDMLNRLRIHSGILNQSVMSRAWLDVLSFRYFQRSIKELWEGRDQRSLPVNGEVPGGGILFKDGRRLLDKEFLSRDIEESRRITIRNLYHGPYVRTLRGQIKPDKGLEEILEKFIQYLMGHNIQVTLCLLPFHPEQYKSFLELQKRPGSFDIVGVEQYYRGLAQRLDLEVIGSYDPAACNLASKDFYDGRHIRNDVIEKMFKQKGSVCSMSGL